MLIYRENLRRGLTKNNVPVTMFAQKDFICDRYKYDPKGACAHDAAGGPKKSKQSGRPGARTLRRAGRFDVPKFLADVYWLRERGSGCPHDGPQDGKYSALAMRASTRCDRHRTRVPDA